MNHEDFVEHLRKQWSQFCGEHQDIHVNAYVERIKYELDVIKQLDFGNYFMIVSDIVNFAKKSGITVESRGSVGGSLVAYVLGITNLDPIKYELYFERFLNPYRIALPDIDLDFDIRRDEVFEYIKKKYGEDNIVYVANYQTYRAKAIMRDTLAYFNIDQQDVHNIETALDKYSALEQRRFKSFKNDKELSAYVDKYPEFFQVADDIIGKYQHISRHAAGIIISPYPIKDKIPQKIDKGIRISQWDKNILERLGYLKMDILRVAMLDTINHTVKAVNKNYHCDLDLNKINLDDRATYEQYALGNTIGTFQFGTPGFIKCCKIVKPSSFMDLIVAVALYRPGSKDYIEQYADNKVNNRVECSIPELTPILAKTYGINVFQEQSIEIFHQLAGLSRAESELLRRSISKSKGDLEKFRNKFLDGCMKNGITSKNAEEIFEIVKKSEDYAFNLAHGAQYGHQAYKTMYLKTHYPGEFLAGRLAYNEDEDAFPQLIAECSKLKLPVKGPEINGGSTCKFDTKTQSVHLSLGMIKGVGEKAVQEIQSKEPYNSSNDFFTRISRKAVNIKTIAALIRAGSFDQFQGGRQEATSLAEKTGKIDPKDLNPNDTITYGFEISKFSDSNTYTLIRDLINNHNRELSFWVIGRITNIRKIIKRTEMVFFNLSDFSGVQTCVVFDNHKKHLVNVVDNTIVIFKLRKVNQMDVYEVIGSEVYDGKSGPN